MPDGRINLAASAPTPFLLQPIGWIYDRLHGLITEDPALAKPLLAITPTRLHVVGLSLAHLDGDCTCEYAHFLLTGRENVIITKSLGNYPIGLHRALRRLPPQALPVDSYRKLIELLANATVAKLLQHTTKSITDCKIVGLHSLPLALRRPAIMAILDACPGIDRFVDGLRILSLRANQTFEIITEQMASLNQAHQIAAKIRQIADSIPLNTTLLPPKIGNFRRLDCPAEICDLAKEWRNCLANYVSNVNYGTSAIYLSETDRAACLVCRYGRLGWFIEDAKGPKNTSVEPLSLGKIHRDFSDHGVFEGSAMETVQYILTTNIWRTSRVSQIDDENLAEMLF